MAFMVQGGVQSAWGVELQGKVDKSSQRHARLADRTAAVYEMARGSSNGSRRAPEYGVKGMVEHAFDTTTGALDYGDRHVKAWFGVNITTDEEVDVFPPPHQNYNKLNKTELRVVYSFDVG